MRIRAACQLIPAGLLLAGLLFAYPLALGRWAIGQLPFWGEAPFCGKLELALLAAAVCLFYLDRLKRLFAADRMSRWWALAAGIACVMAIGRWLLFDTSLLRLSEAGFYLLLPLAGAAAAPELRRLLPGFFALSGVLTLLTLWRELSLGLPPTGIVGNWNWNNTLLAISAAGSVLLFSHGRKAVAFAIAAAGIVVLLWSQFLPGYTSFATLLAFAGSCLGLPLWRRCPARFRSAAALLLLVAAGGVFLLAVLNFQGDTRLELWRATLELIRRSPLTGVGPGEFEFAIPGPLADTGYYLTRFAADRQPHPHNELLFLWAQFGLPGFLAALLLFALALRGIGRLRLSDTGILIPAGIFLMLLFHGQFDVLLSEPLTGGIFLLLAGFCWRNGTPHRRIEKPLSAIGGWRLGAAAFLALFAAIAGLDQFYGGMELRAARAARADGDLAGAEHHLVNAFQHRLTAEKIYFASGLALFDRKDPERTLELLKLYPENLRQPFYSHSLGRAARAHAVLGNREAARESFRKEQEHYPLSIHNALLTCQFLARQGHPDELKTAEERLERLMKLKRVSAAELPLLLRRQILDDTPAELEAYRNEQRKQQP